MYRPEKEIYYFDNFLKHIQSENKCKRQKVITLDVSILILWQWIKALYILPPSLKQSFFPKAQERSAGGNPLNTYILNFLQYAAGQRI